MSSSLIVIIIVTYTTTSCSAELGPPKIAVADPKLIESTVPKACSAAWITVSAANSATAVSWVMPSIPKIWRVFES